jgi:hypothetical protein
MIRKISDKQRKRNQDKGELTKQLHSLFLDIWDDREDPQGNCYCYETGKILPRGIYRNNTCCYDHVLEKSKYKEYTLVKKNILILDPQVHSNKTKNIDSTPRIKKYKEYLLDLHNNNLLKD